LVQVHPSLSYITNINNMTSKKRSNCFTNYLLLLATLIGTSSAFVPNLYPPSVESYANLVTPLKISNVQSNKHVRSFLAVQPTNRRSRCLPALHLLGEAIEEYGDLVVGTFTVFCATSPYVVGVVFPKTMEKLMFKHVYKSYDTLEKEGIDPNLPQSAEVTWKNMYSSVGFFLTLTTFVEANNLNKYDGADVLRDSFVIWTIYYILATIKLRKEDTVLKIVEFNRLPSQAWHITVATVLLICVCTGPKAPLIEQLLRSIGLS